MRGFGQRRARPHELRIEAYGVGIGITCEPGALLDGVHAILPPGWRECSERKVDASFALTAGEDHRVTVLSGASPVAREVEPRLALGVLDSRIRAEISSRAREWIFIHAGVVALDDRALAMPGRSFAGKTSLVAALIARGASYFSDEYAVLDPDGRVHPYPKPLSFRNSDLRIDTTETSADELGAVSAEASARIALVAVTSYRPEADWQPTPGGVADAALALFEYAVLARSEPQRVMGAVASAAADARLLEGDRGEAGETAVALLEALAGASRTTPSRWP